MGADNLFLLFKEVLEWIGLKNIVHVVIDNVANYVTYGRHIQNVNLTIHWYPYAAPLH